jgi:UDP-glucuronate decarboxylase
MNSTRTTLVTGGAGFIGSHLCERLLGEGDRVICLDNMMTGRRENLARLERDPRFELIERDVTRPAPRRLRADRVFHLACAASPPHYQADPIHTMLTCVLGTRNYLEVARRSAGRFLLTSTSEVYGDPEQHPQAEDYRGCVNTTGPRACYDEGKRAAEALAADYRRVWGLDTRIARLFNTYGPRMRPDDGRVVTNFVVQALEGQPLTIYGDGRQTRSFCYIDDMIEGLMRLMEARNGGGRPLNLGNPEEFTIAELARLVMELSGRRVGLDKRPLPEDDPRRRRPNIDRARDVLGWAPTTPLRAGLPPTISHFEHQLTRGAGRASVPHATIGVTAAE